MLIIGCSVCLGKTYEDYRMRPDILQQLSQIQTEVKINPNVIKAIPKAEEIFGDKEREIPYQADKFCDAHLQFVIQLLYLYEDHEIYFLARDAEYLYDLTRLYLYLEGLDSNHIHLINVSRANCIKDRSRVKAYLDQEGINESTLADKRIVLVDVGHSGSIVDYFKNMFPDQVKHIKSHFILGKPGVGIPSMPYLFKDHGYDQKTRFLLFSSRNKGVTAGI